MNFDLDDATILRVVHGSHLYGTNIEGSDRDEKGVCIPPIEYFFGFNSKFEQHETKDPDCAVYDIRKFMSLAANCNPNILEILFVPE
ncbi:nucleotidyltransferase domain-containing protein, partial [Streptococcus pseudopneumoniae]|uniref:DNA polymerase beta superfamily protein n=1 Tax=Streptococcus pseudopneumoniae TaxID=257758 RepID=UPI0018B07576|nr:nucleotidyltransferase domain-containing protein [Streptococcus pseudopneumoniae]